MNNLEQFKGKSIYVINHTDCDAIGVHIILKYFLEPYLSKVKYFMTDDRTFDGFNFEELKNYDYLFITDLGIPKDSYDKLSKYVSPENIYVWDHHISGYRELQGIPNYFYDETKSASLIFYEWIRNQSGLRIRRLIKEFIILCDVYDSWKTEDKLFPSAKRLNYLFLSMKNWYEKNDEVKKHDFFVSEQLKKFDDQTKDSFYFNPMELGKIRKEEEKEKELFEGLKKNLKIREDNQGNKYGYSQLRSKISYLSYVLLKEKLDLKYFCCLNTFLKNEYKIHVRSREGDNFDVSLICEKYAGGGHPCAGAFSFKTEEEFLDFASGKKHLI